MNGRAGRGEGTHGGEPWWRSATAIMHNWRIPIPRGCFTDARGCFTVRFSVPPGGLPYGPPGSLAYGPPGGLPAQWNCCAIRILSRVYAGSGAFRASFLALHKVCVKGLCLRVLRRKVFLHTTLTRVADEQHFFLYRRTPTAREHCYMPFGFPRREMRKACATGSSRITRQLVKASSTS